MKIIGNKDQEECPVGLGPIRQWGNALTEQQRKELALKDLPFCGINRLFAKIPISK